MISRAGWRSWPAEPAAPTERADVPQAWVRPDSVRHPGDLVAVRGGDDLLGVRRPLDEPLRLTLSLPDQAGGGAGGGLRPDALGHALRLSQAAEPLDRPGSAFGRGRPPDAGAADPLGSGAALDLARLLF